jgi:outer membrane protein OmpA-like peptidoglycan-associated protein
MKPDREPGCRGFVPLGEVAVLWTGIIALMLLGACAKKNVFVLLPDEEGKIGRIVVSTKGGDQLLTEPRQATDIGSAADAPSAPFTMSEKAVGDTFGEALTALPLRPIHFVLYFRSGTADLTPESVKTLEEVYSAVRERKSTDISVVGHTDRVGSRESNFRLGMERTDQVKRLLVSQGIDGAFIDTSSHGEDNPLVKTEDEVAEPRNRRVEVVVR